MADNESEGGTVAPGSDRKIMYMVIIIAVAILAVFLITTTGSPADLPELAGGGVARDSVAGISLKTVPGAACVKNGGMDCSGQCVEPKTDIRNCGSCGNVCDDSFVCSNGTCISPTDMLERQKQEIAQMNGVAKQNYDTDLARVRKIGG